MPWTRPKPRITKWRLVPAPRRAEILYRAAETLVKRKEDLARDMTREMGKASFGNARRRAGSHRHDVLHGRGRAPAVRADGALRASQQICDVGARSAGRRGHDYAVEFPDGHSFLENHAGADLRQYGGDQARRGHAAIDLQPGANSDGIGLAAGSRERRERHGAGRGSAAGHASRRDGRKLHRFDRNGPHRESGVRVRRSSPATWRWAARISLS